jgi:hypothetical protein
MHYTTSDEGVLVESGEAVNALSLSGNKPLERYA